jgi:type IV pilus assembly protein PilM
MKAGIGLDVGTTTVRLAVVRLSKDSASLIHFASEPMHTSEGMSDVVDPEALTATLKALLSGTRLPKANVSVGLSNQRMVAREVELPWVPQKELRPALPMLAADLLPMPVEESVLDFLPAEESIDKEGARQLKGMLIAANEEIVTLAVEAVERAGLAVDRVDFGPLAALHSVCDPATVGPEAVLDVGATSSSLVVHQGNRPTFVRIMARGGDSITEALADDFHIDKADAERWKQAVGVMWPTMSPDDQRQTGIALDRAASDLIDEVRSSVMFFRNKSERRLTGLWMVGGGASQFGLDYQLREALHVDVRRAHAGARLASGDPLVMAQPSPATAVGLALAVAA